MRYSAVEVLRQQDLSALTAEEWVEAQRLISALGSRRSCARRGGPGRRGAGPAAIPTCGPPSGATCATGGIPIRPGLAGPVERPRRLVLLLDVSGSMEPYARGLARFAHAAVMSRRSGRVEVFTMGTRLTRITRELTRRDPDAALASAARSVTTGPAGPGWGSASSEFNDEWGVRGMARGPSWSFAATAGTGVIPP